MVRKGVIVILSLFTLSCSTYIETKKNNEILIFSEIRSNYKVTDLNRYNCEKIGKSVIEHILEKGILVTRKEVHDHYSVTGCSVKGELMLNGNKTEFTFDYGGIIHFSNGMIFVCGEECCSESYPYCSFDPDNLKGI